MIASFLNTKIHEHVADNSNNEIRGGGVKRDVGRDEKQLIKYAWPNKAINNKKLQLATLTKLYSN